MTVAMEGPSIVDDERRDEPSSPELSIILPCLNESETVEGCVRDARWAVETHGIDAEVIVADNGSTDGSGDIAFAAGARVVHVQNRGYGNALLGGIAASRGRFVIMGDADASYDFGEVPRLLERLRDGDELVMGCRLPTGGGEIKRGAMPALHRILGNPLLSSIVRRWFAVKVHDVYCGLRGFRRELIQELHVQSPGMEFAAEMVIKAGLFRRRMSEVPITLRVDGRRLGRPHLRTFRDGWTTLCLFLMCCPRRLFLLPGAGLIVAGCVGYVLALLGANVSGAVLGAHTLLVSSLALMMGYQSILFAAFTKFYGISAGLLPPSDRFVRVTRWLTPGRGLFAGTAALLSGLALILVAWNDWRLAGFGPLNYATEMRWVIPGVTLAAMGFQTTLAGFFAGILRLGQR